MDLQPSKPTSPRSGPEEHSAVILVVDDLEENRYVLRRYLSAAGYRVIEATTGEEALQQSKRCPDLILLDVQLPDMLGYEVVRRIKRDAECARIPIIHTSATFISGQNHQAGIESGADAYLTTPVDRLVLLSTVQAWLRVRKSEQERSRTEEALRQSEEFRRQALEAGRMATWQVDLKTGKLTRSSEWDALFGFEAKDQDVFQDMAQLIHPEDRARVERAWTEAAKSGQMYQDEYRLILPTGAVRWVGIRAQTKYDSTGEPRYFTGIVADITERKSAELLIEQERNRLYESFIDAPVVISVHRGKNLVVEFANNLYRRVIGTDAEIKGMTLEESIPSVTPELVAIHRNVMETGRPYQSKELSAIFDYDRNGQPQERIWNVIYQPVHDPAGRVDGVMTCAFEVTEQVKARRKLEQSERELAAERHKLDLIFQKSAAAMAVWSGPDMVFERVNPFYQALFPDRELLGKPFLEAIPEFRGQPFIDIFRKVLETGEPFVGHEVLTRHRRTIDGPIEDRYYDFTYVQLQDQEGKPYGVYDHAIDVTERVIARKINEENEENLHRYAESMPQMAFIANTAGEITYFNSKHYEYFGLNRNQQESSRWKEQNLHHPDDLQRAIHAWSEAVRTGKTYEVEYRLRRKDGVYRWHLARAVPDRDPNGIIRAWYGTNTDIHELKEAQARLEEERELREQFVVTLTHDLRTPLTAAKMSAQLLSRKPEDPAMVQRFSGRIADSLDRADRMIRDLLDAGRIRAGERLPIEIESCDLREIASETIADFSTIYGDRFRLVAPASVPGHWSASGVRRILENLCNNAIKYGAEQRPVTVTLSRGEETVQVEVHNEGNPIPPEEQKTLFEPFRRAASAEAGNQKGWGLGLTLVKGIVEAHHGRVEIESSAETGTTFRVTLPIDAGR